MKLIVFGIDHSVVLSMSPSRLWHLSNTYVWSQSWIKNENEIIYLVPVISIGLETSYISAALHTRSCCTLPLINFSFMIFGDLLNKSTNRQAANQVTRYSFDTLSREERLIVSQFMGKNPLKRQTVILLMLLFTWYFWVREFLVKLRFNSALQS